MSRVRSADTRPERLVRSLLHRRGFRFRKNVRSLPGSPDVVLPKHQAVVLVHGCYWHRHDCRRGQSVPTKDRAKWLAKFDANVRRDRDSEAALTGAGWRVFTVWECELKRDAQAVVDALASAIRSED